MMQTLRGGLVAGLLAGLVLAMLDFVTDGTPGRLLPEALHWFGITTADPTISRFAGFFLLIALGGVFGLIFGALQRERIITISRALLSGLALGFVWWLIFSLLLANIISHRPAVRGGVGGHLLPTPATACSSGSVVAITREKLMLCCVLPAYRPKSLDTEAQVMRPPTHEDDRKQEDMTNVAGWSVSPSCSSP